MSDIALSEVIEINEEEEAMYWDSVLYEIVHENAGDRV